MTPEQLITFATVAEHGNISRAAIALHLSQPAVSGQLRQLQDEFGEPLYLRNGRGVRLTAAGEQLVQYAGRIRRPTGRRMRTATRCAGSSAAPCASARAPRPRATCCRT